MALFEQLKTDADGLAAAAVRLRRERNGHARRGYGIVKRRIGSPPGLIACFAAGVFAGARSRRPDGAGKARTDGRPPEREPREGTFAAFLRGPLGAAAVRLGTAFIAGALLQPHSQEDGSAGSDLPL